MEAINNCPLWKTVVASAILYVVTLPAIRVVPCVVLPFHFGPMQSSAAVMNAASGIRVQGPGIPPQLGFANKDVIEDLKDLHAEVVIPILDFSPERAANVRSLDQAGIAVVAWMMLSKEEGFYLNTDNAPQAAERVTQFEKWSSDNNLKWAAVGLDSEPNFIELTALRTHRWRLITTLVGRLLNGARITRARNSYLDIVHQIQSRGCPVQSPTSPPNAVFIRRCWTGCSVPWTFMATKNI